MKTVVLVIGNNNYKVGTKLDNAVNDATAIAEAFERLQYDIILKTDCDNQLIGDALTEFEEKLKTADAGIFYFAGHGFQCEGENYLAGTECPTDEPNKHICERTCIRLAEIIDIFKNANTKTNIAIIDACRKTIGRGASDSFSPISVPSGTIIAFSTSPGDGAKDKGMEGHSVYTGALLRYIGREFLTVEELFKKVRKTVFNFTGGAQTSWEHTSLVGDFFFNTGQLIHSPTIPYDENVVKDRHYIAGDDNIDKIISDLKSCNWDLQNPAISRLSKIQPSTINKNKQFLLGRNILQASAAAFAASNFLEDLDAKLTPFLDNGENHLLNGILFEIYFDNNGDFRNGKFKTYNFDKIMALRKFAKFSRSFEFISNILSPYKDSLFYIPSSTDLIIDVDFKVSQTTNETFDGETVQIQIAELIKVGDRNITKSFSEFCRPNRDEEYIKESLSEFLLVPKELININSNIKLTKVRFQEFDDDIEY
jgi:hypothetical protein